MPTILIIEDHLDNARFMMRSLETLGYRLLHAADGQSGLQLAVEEAPDLILLDMGLPDLDGQTLAILLHAHPALKETPIIAVTAWPPDTAREMAEAYGCTGYISKPLQVQDFRAKIASYIPSA